MMLCNVLCRTQQFLHGKSSKSSMALPAVLLVVAMVLVIYQHLTVQQEERDLIKTFLALIMLQMVPLVLLEVKLLHCENPAELLCRFGTKVLAMHVCFVLLRILGGIWVTGEFSLDYHNLFFLTAAFLTMHFGFNRDWICSIWNYRDVSFLIVLSIAAAVVTEELEDALRSQKFGYYRNNDHLFELVVGTASNYIEILAFVPAVWMVYQASKVQLQNAVPMDDAGVQRRVLSFFAFLIAFYSMEDLHAATQCFWDLPVAAIAHCVHFMLLLDIAGFITAQVVDPERLKSGVLQWFPDACCAV